MKSFLQNSLLVASLCCGGSLSHGADMTAAINYEPDWESLKRYECPEWFRDAKFGIWAHWGPQSVPQLGDWYGRFLYNAPNQTNKWRTEGGAKAYAYHLKHYGHPSQFGYKDLIPLFKAEHWNPTALMELYHKAGARYFMSMGQHHDNFDMWDSKHQPWNSVNMGPRRDIVREWQTAAKQFNMRFGVSFHGSSAWSWFEPSRGADADGPLKGVPYDGNLTKADGAGKWWDGYDPQDLYCRPHKEGEPPDEPYKTKFINRVFDLVDNYRPDLIYFDGGLPFNRLDIASEFYNRSQSWHKQNEAVINIKGVPPERRKAVVYDIENGQAGDLLPNPWQTDASFDGWFVVSGGRGAPTKKIVQQLTDIVSKNGNLMLNITQRPDGTISDFAANFLKEMAAWMDVNSEAIHGTRPWVIYGEGPTKIADGESKKSQRLNYTAKDIRFTTKGRSLYALIMEWPGEKVTIKSLTPDRELWFGEIKEVQLLGHSAPLKWQRDASGLTVSLPEKKADQFVYVVKISGE